MASSSAPSTPISIALLPLRTPSGSDDFVSMISNWLDSTEHNTTADFSSSECMDDLERLADLRNRVADNDAAVLQEYHSCLLECTSRGLAVSPSSSTIQLHWQSSNLSGSNHNSAVETMDVASSLTAERINVLWNLAVFEIQQATEQPLIHKPGWSKAASHLQNSATIVKVMVDASIAAEDAATSNGMPQQSGDLSSPFLRSWLAILVALSQRCVYESLACAKKPRHLLLAKLAAAAVPLFNQSHQSQQQQEEQNRGSNSISQQWADHANAWSIYMSSCAEDHQACIHRDRQQNGMELARLDLAVKFATLCQEFCNTLSPSMSILELQEMADKHCETISTRYQKAQQEHAAALAANTSNRKQPQQVIPDRSDLPEIRGEKLVNIDQPLEKVFKAFTLDSKPMFARLLSPNVRRYVDLFRTDMDKFVFQMASVAEERTEGARKTLATVHLPHSLTAYRQEQAGGGIPDELWERVNTIQQERKVQQLKQDLWGLRDVAEQARTTYQRIESQLDFDLESDRLFRQENMAFEGHDAREVQKTFRHSLSNYDKLLVTAQEGDQVLLRRLEILDTNPKYKLLQFQKSQLDRLLPGANAANNNGAPSSSQQHMAAQPIDTSHLSRLLVELSALFHERDVLLNAIKDEVKVFDVQPELAQVDPRSPTADQEYRNALTKAQKSFDGIVYEMEKNMETQNELVQTILEENEQFQFARRQEQQHQQSASANNNNNNNQNGPLHGGPSQGNNMNAAGPNLSASDSCIAMIEDAIDEIEQLTKHLKEGKDFYEIVIPKLEKLKQQVGDVSARLTVERLEYDDKAHRSRQEQADAAFAKRMSEANPSSNNGGPSPPPPPPPPGGMGNPAAMPSGPGGGGGHMHNPGPIGGGNNNNNNNSNANTFAQHVSHAPQVRVDDEKVATLVGMEFDPAKVVAALAKHDNNMDQALNELLSG